MTRHGTFPLEEALARELRGPDHRSRAKSQTPASEARMGTTSVSHTGAGCAASSHWAER